MNAPFYSEIESLNDISLNKISTDNSNLIISDPTMSEIPNSFTVFCDNLHQPLHQYTIKVNFQYADSDKFVNFYLNLYNHIPNIIPISMSNNLGDVRDASGGTLFYHRYYTPQNTIQFDISSNFTQDVSGEIMLQKDHLHNTPPYEFQDFSLNLIDTSNNYQIIMPIDNDLHAGIYRIIYYSTLVFTILW